MPDVILTLDPTTHAALRRIAGEEGCDLPALIRDAIRRDLFRRTRAKKAVRPDERLVAPLRALLADDLAYSTGWDDLQRRLRNKGFVFREAGGGLALFRLDTGVKAAKASDLGYSYTRLMRRFGQPMPGHSHSYLTRHLP